MNENLEISQLMKNGEILFKAGKFEEAIKNIEEILTIQPGNFFAWNNKGVILIELKKHEGCQSGMFLWSRVYSNGSTHHELYCANCCHNANKSLVRIAVIPAELSLERLSKFIMPIGKHAGEPLANIPRDYLSWVATDFKQVNVRRKAFAYLEMTKPST